MTEIKVIQADITKLEVDAIVNAANNSLLGGAGVDGAIHRQAGPELLDATRALNGCQTGQAKITEAYQLPSRYIIHTVGPIYRGGSENEAELLSACYRSSLELARQYRLKSIAFPAISCGVYGYPKNEAVKIAVDTVQEVTKNMEIMLTVYFVCFESLMYELYENYLNEAQA
ncbi:O-acetyl-ADP-ribose deacetylase [Thiotrichales bacterium 19S3-7]|nr:O-acetyl-ADP-ribose deacetylase [Thiotrichales bacterium 19S3-7]MCF6802000.1 O-acetyl-ADP-ribose deacetylase [Thiotrichales bacterium 19S3-11]